mgnify:CR=1 FL=1
MLDTGKARELIDNIEECQLLLDNPIYDKYKSELQFQLVEIIRELCNLANGSLYNYKW